MKLAIIEGEEVHAELLTRHVKAWGKDRSIPVVITSFPSVASFLSTWEDNRNFDVLFVDIQVKETDGIEVARQVRKNNPGTVIIFMTGTADHVEERHETKMKHYLVKPVDQEKLNRCMDLISKGSISTQSGNEKFLPVQIQNGMMKIALDKIMYIKAQGNGCVIEFCPQPGRTFQLESVESISALEERLDNSFFKRCHRSYIVRIDKIRHISRACIELENGSKIKVSRMLYGDVSRMFVRCLRRTKAKVNNI